jgi:hypothetical protein
MTATTPASLTYDVPGLIALLRHQRDLYTDLHELSERQAPLVEQGAAEALLEVLARRQKLIDELAQINAQLSPYREDWSRVWRHVPEPDRPEVSALLKTVSDLLAAILEQDEADRARLQSSQDRVKVEMKKINGGTLAVRAYGGRPMAGVSSAAPRFTDRQA